MMINPDDLYTDPRFSKANLIHQPNLTATQSDTTKRLVMILINSFEDREKSTYQQEDLDRVSNFRNASYWFEYLGLKLYADTGTDPEENIHDQILIDYLNKNHESKLICIDGVIQEAIYQTARNLQGIFNENFMLTEFEVLGDAVSKKMLPILGKKETME